LPDGVTAGEIAWPVPTKIRVGTLANFGYEGTVLLPVPFTITAAFMPSASAALDVRFKASWLVCKVECIPEEGEFALRLPVASTTTTHDAVFKAAFSSVPQDLSAGGSVRIEGNALRITAEGLPASLTGKQLEFFPETADVIETAGAWTQAWERDRWVASVPISPQRSQSPDTLPIVLAYGGKAWRTVAPVSGTWPTNAGAPVPSIGPGALLDGRAGKEANVSLAAALLGALIGGLILNLMPCVFPVLAIKIVGFAQHGSDRRSRHLGAYAYAAGVVLSFLALGGLLLALRSAGEQLGWGFQLQSPMVVAALAALFTVLGLNLAGVFEFGSFLPPGVASLQARHPVADSFLSGVLAVAIASPCTAPFMGASLGLAVALPPAQAMLVFGALGIGMALPYLAAALVPSIARLVPRPGAWMDVFRKLMAFPMFATVAWLIWVLGRQSGADGAGALLAMLVGLSMLVWSLTLGGRSRVTVATLAISTLTAMAFLVGPSVTAVQAAPGAAKESPWQVWDKAKVNALVADDRPVFVDFTAAWCVTCQYNKRTTLANQTVLDDFARRNVVLLRADWTNRDPAITEALASLGRSGVPVYVLYRKGQPPRVLSEILSVDEVRTALATL
jgi:thiol:disulfide interchange protein